MVGKKNQAFRHTNLTAEELLQIAHHEYVWMYSEFACGLVLHPARIAELRHEVHHWLFGIPVIPGFSQMDYDTVVCLARPLQEVIDEIVQKNTEEMPIYTPPKLAAIRLVAAQGTHSSRDRGRHRVPIVERR